MHRFFIDPSASSADNVYISGEATSLAAQTADLAVEADSDQDQVAASSRPVPNAASGKRRVARYAVDMQFRSWLFVGVVAVIIAGAGCDGSGSDSGCNGAADCPAAKPFCFDAPGGRCIECVADSDCVSGACDAITPEGDGTGDCEEL